MLPTRLTESNREHGRSRRSFADDDRAIEGLPIRLVIALVVGVAALGIMLNILGGIGDFGETELEVELSEDTVQLTEIGNRDDITVSVLDEDGNEVEDVTVIATPGSAQMDEAISKETDEESNEAVFDFEEAGLGLRPDQSTGTVEFDVVPPGGSNYVDEQANQELVVIDG